MLGLAASSWLSQQWVGIKVSTVGPEVPGLGFSQVLSHLGEKKSLWHHFLGKLTAFLTFFFFLLAFLFSLRQGSWIPRVTRNTLFFWYFLFYAVQIAFTISERAVARR